MLVLCCAFSVLCFVRCGVLVVDFCSVVVVGGCVVMRVVCCLLRVVFGLMAVSCYVLFVVWLLSCGVLCLFFVVR